MPFGDVECNKHSDLNAKENWVAITIWLLLG
jgi:hypothetical protein